MAQPETWTIIIDDVRFRLDRMQLYYEPSSYLISQFFNPQGQSIRTELAINGEPGLWKLIQSHLRGYEILPIKDGVVPYLSKEATLASLNTIAIAYGFTNLQRKLQLELAATRPKKYRLLVRPGTISWDAASSEGVEISKETFEALIVKVACSPLSISVAQIQVTGYRQVVAWAEYNYEITSDKKHTKTFALFESI
ncbi:hypothetical protein FRC17_004522 [Serendipita sp. 399]|nr:hypothetical protein FRC17_004522 [Serendipita sp. 399]